MRRSLSAVLVGLMAMALCACGETTEEPSSPYVGTWTATSVLYEETEFGAEEVFTDGMELELRDNGVCQLTVGEQSDPLSWSAGDDGSVTISDGETDFLGTISEDEIVLEIGGMYVSLTRDGAEGETGQDQEDTGLEEGTEEAG